MESKETALAIAKALQDKKAFDIKVLEILDLTPIADYFVICSGTSSTHLKALCDEVEHQLGEKGVKPIHLEGYRSANWILADYSDVVLHIFNREFREFYNIERLWSDAIEIEVPEINTQV